MNSDFFHVNIGMPPPLASLGGHCQRGRRYWSRSRSSILTLGVWMGVMQVAPPLMLLQLVYPGAEKRGW
jgi:hypothetical protein